jgi:hypothetical protein
MYLRARGRYVGVLPLGPSEVFLGGLKKLKVILTRALQNARVGACNVARFGSLTALLTLPFQGPERFCF